MDPREQYRRTRILTASPGELLIMLYDGAITRIRKAYRCAKADNWADAGAAIVRAQEIIYELIACLKRDENPELVDNLSNLYVYCIDLLSDATRSHNEELLQEVDSLLAPLREAWSEAEKQTKEQPSENAVMKKRAGTG